jgi:hypothetical protein
MQKIILIIAACVFTMPAFKNPNSFIVNGNVTDIDGNHCRQLISERVTQGGFK